MSILSEEIKRNGEGSYFEDAAVAEIEALEKENEKLKEAVKCFRYFVRERGGSWAEMLEILESIK
jgi:hypothetical protein